MTAQPPSGTVTFLFTDIQGSTRQWEDSTEEMRDLVAEHDSRFRAAIEANDGYVVKARGDGFHAAFSRAADAVKAAEQLQAATVDLPGIKVRIGLNTGEAQERDGDYFGPAVNRAARIVSAANGGQVLIAGVTADLVPGLTLRNLGEHRLPDLGSPMLIWQLGSEEFPPLHTLDELPGNLPAQRTTFIGRADEVRELAALVAHERLVTLTGVGGVGKTRLVLQVAADLLPEFRDGAWVSELAPAGEADAMLGIVATTFSVQQRVGSTLEESIAEALRTRELLWVVDNCEHLIEPVAGLVDRVLRLAPGVRILATSREGLDVDGERITSLRSLSLADSNDVDLIVHSDAVLLFEDRARAVRKEYRVDADNAKTVDELCRRLDGIPLAIVLAASRVASLGVAEILSLLDERFRLLTGGRRVALERHQTLRAAVDWSYSLLQPVEATVFTRLAVFAGSFDARATRAIVTDDEVDEWAVLDAIDGLARKSMAVADEQPDGSVRFQLLETLRQYARERLEQEDPGGEWRRRHADYYVAFSEEAGVGLRSRDEFSWRARLNLELDNLRAATQWAFDVEDVALLKRVVFALFHELSTTSLSLGPIATRALSLADDLPREEQGWIMANAAIETYDGGESAHTSELVLESWALGISADRPTPALAYYVSGGNSNLMAPQFMRELIEVRQRWSDSALRASGASGAVLSQLRWGFVNTALLLREVDLAREWADRGYELARQSGNPSSLAAALLAVGMSRLINDPDGALRAFEGCIALHRQGAEAAGSGAASYQGSLVYARRGEHHRASSQLFEAIEELRPQGRSSVLDGACGYAIEILSTLGYIEATVVVLGSVFSGELRVLRDISVPADRQPLDVRAIRGAIGETRFTELLSVGARMSYDEILDHIVASLESES